MSVLSEKRILVTGAGGFIGSHLVEKLLELDATVLGIDNFITGSFKNLRPVIDHSHFRFVEQSVTSDPMSYLHKSWKLDYVFHLASPASPPHYQKFPVETYQANIWGAHTLLSQLLDRHKEAKFVYASTSEVYGDPLVHPQTEDYWGNVNPNGIRSCYDEAKRMGETICGVFYRDFGIDTRIARIFNTYGPRMNPKDGRIIPNFVTQALKNEPVTVYGDGSQTRSYCYVSDLVDGLIALATTPEAKGETINIGNPDEKTVLETAQKIIAQTNSTSEIIHKDLPADDPTRRKPDITKAKTLLKWEPKIGFEQGLSKTVRYFKDKI